MSGSKPDCHQASDAKAAWLLAALVFVFQTIPAASQNENNTVGVTIILGDGRWSLGVGIDGAATLTHDTVPWSAIRVASGTLPFREVVEDVARAMSMAPQPPDPKRDYAGYREVALRSEVIVGLLDLGSTEFRSGVAVFTPEIKAHFDRVLSGDIPAAMQRATNEFPVFPERILKKIAQWTNNALIPAQIPRQPGVTVSKTNSASPPVFITRTDSDPKHMRGRAQSAKDFAERDSDRSEPASVDPRDKPLGFRGWLVIGLLAIAALLTYRFIRLRIGS